jgi:TrpR-related protein YerC/YecD
MKNNELKYEFDAICTVLSKIGSKDVIFNILRDLMTEKEMIELSRRFEVAKMLEENISYSIIEKKTGMSSTTIARISKFLN